jgi:hypothetical protein
MFGSQGHSCYTRSVLPAVCIVIAAVIGSTVTPVRADVRVGGTPDAVRIEMRNASVEETLGALRSAFGVHYRSDIGLEKQLSGTYQGPLQAVVTRVLDGYSFVVKSSGGSLEITVLGTGNAGARAAAPPSFEWKSAPVPSAAQTPSPAPAANDERSPPSAAPSPVLKLADGSTPPMPVPAQGQGPLPVPQPLSASIAPPRPLTGGTPVSAPVPQPSAVAPPNPDETRGAADGARPKEQ